MIKELLEALESNKFITINLTQNGPLVMAVITGRSQKGADSPPLNVCVEPDELEKAVAAALTETWKKARQSDRKSEKEEKKPEPQPEPEPAPAEEFDDDEWED